MRCPTCAAFVEDDATSCTSCGSEIDASPPPPLPENFEPPAEESPADAPAGPPGDGDRPAPRPSSDSSGVCDGCQNSFPPMQLSRIHGQRLCDDCADRQDRASGSHPAAASASGRQPSSGRQDQAVSKGPLVVVALVVVVLIGVAIYFTVIAPGPSGTQPAPTPSTVQAPAPAPAPATPVPTPVVQPPPIKRPEDITIQGTLQPFKRSASGDVAQIEFKDAVNDFTLVVTETDRYVAQDLTPGKRYRVSFRAIRSDTNTQSVKYSLDIQFEPVESGG